MRGRLTTETNIPILGSRSHFGNYPKGGLATSESNGGNVEIRFIREIVYPNHVEIEGATPKALPSPDVASPTLPRPTDPDDTNEGAV